MQTKKRISESGFKLLLSFLNDADDSTLNVVKEQLKSILKLRPNFRQHIEDLKDPILKNLGTQLLEEWRYEENLPAFERLFRQGRQLDLEKGVYLLAKMEYPKLKLRDMAQKLDAMAEKVDQMIGGEPPLPTRPVTAMRRYLFEVEKFRGNENNYFDPQNLFINRVLEDKIGIPISLSCVYLFVAWRLKLLAHGIGLPGHFIVGHRVPRGVVYIDPFNKGRLLRVKDCEVLVKRLGIPFKQSYLDPMDNMQILSRMIVNLINFYNDQGHILRAQWLARLFQLINQ